jgi:thiol-disulfide isomerase/thioredoxin
MWTTARFALCLTLLAASCDRKETRFTPPRPIARRRPPAEPVQPTFPASCARAVGALLPDTRVRDDRVLLVLFWATWSAPDRALIRALEPEIARDADRWRLIKNDIDDHPAVARDCNILSVPTLVAFVKGKPVSQIVGAVSAERIRQFLEAVPVP